MVLKKVAPYGEWDSPISIDDVTAGSKAVSSPRGDVSATRAPYSALPQDHGFYKPGRRWCTSGQAHGYGYQAIGESLYT